VKKKSVVRYLYGYRYRKGKDYVYFNYKKIPSTAYYGWERKAVKRFFGIDVLPNELIKIRMTIEEI